MQSKKFKNSNNLKESNESSKKYKIPDHNIWDYSEMESWMHEEVTPFVWSETILPEIWEIISKSCKKASKYTVPKEGAFEIFGADFGELIRII